MDRIIELQKILYRAAPIAVFIYLILLSAQTNAQPVSASFAENDGAGFAFDAKFTTLAAQLERELASSQPIRMISWGNNLNTDETLERLQSGDVDLAVVPLSHLSKQSPNLDLFNLTFLFPDLTAVESFQQSSDGLSMLDALNTSGMEAVGYVHRGMYQFASPEPIVSPADLKGMKHGTLAADVVAKQLEAMGVSVIRAGSDEMDDALERGWLNSMGVATDAASQHQGQLSIINAPNYAYSGDVVIMSKEFLSTYNSDQQEMAREIVGTFLRTANAETVYKEQKSLEALKVADFSPEKRLEWLSGATTGWTQVGAKVDEALVKQVLLKQGYDMKLIAGDTLTVFQPEETLHWNTWLEREGQVVQKNEVRSNELYTFVLDLSMLDLQNILNDDTITSTSIGSELAATIAESSDDKIDLQIRAIGIGVALTNVEQKSQHLVIDLEKLQSTDTSKLDLTSLDRDKLAQIGRLGFTKDSKDRMEIGIQTGEDSCAAIALSVWNKKEHRPLDHIVYRFKVGSDSNTVKCTENDATTELLSGLSTLLRSTIYANIHAEAPRIDAAMHVFEVNDVHYTDKVGFAIFSTSSDATGMKDGFHTWQMADPLSVTLNSNALANLLSKAQKKAMHSESNPEAYLKVAKQIKKWIFNAVADEQENANKAFNALNKITSQEGAEKHILARLVSVNGDLLYLPLRMLSAGGNSSPLGENFRVIQPLRRGVYNSADTCVEPWTLGFPPALMAKLEQEMQIDELLASNSPHKVIQSFNNLERFLMNSSPSQSATEGLFIVAHQHGGIMTFGEDDELLTPGTIQREFSGGSVAILAACEVVGMDTQVNSFMNKLNDQNVDLIIASPYQVPLKFGVLLGIEFGKEVEIHSTRESSDGAYVIDTFKSAVRNASEALAKERDKQTIVNSADLPTEILDIEKMFVYFGDHGTQLCQVER